MYIRHIFSEECAAPSIQNIKYSATQDIVVSRSHNHDLRYLGLPESYLALNCGRSFSCFCSAFSKINSMEPPPKKKWTHVFYPISEKKHSFLGGVQDSAFCLSGKSNVLIKATVEWWWLGKNRSTRGEKILSQCYFVYLRWNLDLRSERRSLKLY